MGSPIFLGYALVLELITESLKVNNYVEASIV